MDNNQRCPTTVSAKSPRETSAESPWTRGNGLPRVHGLREVGYVVCIQKQVPRVPWTRRTHPIMLVLTAQLCLYTLFQTSLEGIPKTANMKMIDYWNMFTMTVSLTNFFTLFLWEILQFKGIHSHLKIITRTVIPLLTLVGVISYWSMAGLLYFEYI